MNKTIETMLNHKSIRKFKNRKIEKSIVEKLVDVARHTSSSSFMQSYSIISVNNEQKKQAIADISNQQYIADSGHLFIMVVDQNRNMRIAKENKQDTEVLGSFDRFFIGASDALLASQNILLATESLGLGGVLLGSILNDVPKLIDILELPDFVFPVLGIAIGYPDQEPQHKPRLPKTVMHFEDTYKVQEDINKTLEVYDEVVSQYYDLRDENKRVEKFTHQITTGMNRKVPGRMKLLDYLKIQGFIKY